MKTDITDLIEKMPAFEARCGVRLEALYGDLSSDSGEFTVQVRGELHALAGESISESIDLVLTVYDDKGRVVATTNTWFNNETFFVFETFDLICFDVPTHPMRLRLHPKPS